MTNRQIALSLLDDPTITQDAEQIETYLDHIERLAANAFQAGDLEADEICHRALEGDAVSYLEALEMLSYAEAQR